MILFVLIGILIVGYVATLGVAGSTPSIRWPAVVHYLFAALYYSSLPIHHLLFGFTRPELPDLTHRQTFLIVLMTSASGPAFAIGLRSALGLVPRFLPVVQHRPRAIKLSKELPTRKFLARRSTRRLGRICALLLILLLAVAFTLFTHNVLTAGSYVGNYTQNYTNPVFALFATFVVLIAALAFCLTNGLTAYLFLALPLAWGIYSSNKDPLVIAFFALLYRFGVFRRATVFRTSAVITLLSVSAVVAVPLFSAYRAGEIRNARISVEYMDMKGPFHSLHDSLSRYRSDTAQPSYGLGYARTAPVIVPRFLYPDRPLAPSEQYARANIPNWQPGRGLGYSPLAEALNNFGYYGFYFHYLLFGLLFGVTWSLLFAFTAPRLRPVCVLLFFVFGSYLLTISHRNAMIGPLKRLFMIGIPFFLVLHIGSFIFQRLVKPQCIVATES